MRRRRTVQPNPLRLLVMLAVLWATGTLLFAAESPAPAREAAQQAQRQAQSAPRSEGVTTAAADSATPAQPATGDSQQPRGSEAPSTPRSDGSSAAPSGRAAESGSTAKGETGAAVGTPQRFVPSEQVRADFDVSFPIDI
ncbi:MAG: hypothetical protein C0P74_000605 [Gammaproteobacteria bacterium]|nr:hypothetical protein [Gammaproteobacteria bacterium]